MPTRKLLSVSYWLCGWIASGLQFSRLVWEAHCDTYRVVSLCCSALFACTWRLSTRPLQCRRTCKLQRATQREREREREPRIHAFPVPILRANFSPLNFSPPFLATSAANVALQTASLPRDMGTLRFPQHTLLNHGDGTTGLSKANKSVQLSSFILNLWPWDWNFDPNLSVWHKGPCPWAWVKAEGEGHRDLLLSSGTHAVEMVDPQVGLFVDSLCPYSAKRSKMYRIYISTHPSSIKPMNRWSHYS